MPERPTDPQIQLEAAIHRAIRRALPDAPADAEPMLRPASDPRFGDFQANAAMGLAKQLKRKPREVAEAIAAALGDAGGLLAGPAAVAGPGFLNLTLSAEALGELAAGLDPTRPGEPTGTTVVVDYGSPNLAKEMHVGHLRSSVIGDALCRVLERRGDRVIRQNHIGDWGTQFGMLLEHLIETGWADREGEDRAIGDLNELYQQAKRRDDADPAFAESARRRVVALQAGEPEARAFWRSLIGESLRHMNEVFARLGLLLDDGDLKPESAYNEALGPLCRRLESGGHATRSDGALCVFVAGFETPLIIEKSDGGHGYATTDLAAAAHRVKELGGDRLVYVVDSRQREHFQKFFAAARDAGLADAQTRMDHAAFGTILGPDKRPFKTRDGGTVKLTDVLDEAVEKATAVVAQKNPDLPADEREAVGRLVGIGAVKYADLSGDRVKDYVFDWGRMLALEGNTAPYLQYSYARIRSIFRKGGVDFEAADLPPIAAEAPAERALVLHLARYAATLDAVADSLEPHRLAAWAFELATLYHRFYEACPVLKDGHEATRGSRLALSRLVAEALEDALGLLGIGVPERM
ncbi:arginine--tRNA ligase [Phycisphaera mikurensis]|uniref:Arginine--tRNA ligase n=1 Tax=Phycisphaera mikurensis (strain NBRC 102666 / KCTC 22515 / FYK2301M01) TaxID=1142394 RepID=I0IGI3_PHYMF|nr:arginine--tRNA ligase [Phycisphaera mikurensis]MBB6442948.1 arginyl-tRNA synthetase [Phycisphaera mikurensis]BAM04371.1 arginyl-tRNA synthetase [Phycisphaera mikurensis NBRC 102666]